MDNSWYFDFQITQSPKDILEPFLVQKQKELSIFLSYYFKKEGAVAENVKPKTDIEFESKNSGSIVLEFDLVHFNACLAIHEKAREEIMIRFEIDEIFQKLKLTGPFWPIREMDEI